MSSPELPYSQASTVTENAGPPNEKRDIRVSDEKTDPWLVSFAPDDSENPLVRLARFCPLSNPHRFVSDL